MISPRNMVIELQSQQTDVEIINTFNNRERLLDESCPWDWDSLVYVMASPIDVYSKQLILASLMDRLNAMPQEHEKLKPSGDTLKSLLLFSTSDPAQVTFPPKLGKRPSPGDFSAEKWSAWESPVKAWISLMYRASQVPNTKLEQAWQNTLPLDPSQRARRSSANRANNSGSSGR